MAGFIKVNAFATTVLKDTTYVVMVKDWTSTYIKEQTGRLVQLQYNRHTMIEHDFSQTSGAYLGIHSGENGDAAVAAILGNYPGALNIYKADDSNPHEFYPVEMGTELDQAMQVQSVVQKKYCPTYH
ncbi:hypothetical protein [Mucilaginibacter panaciglaebae]|uniref:hypothetical protein n=1 Tax=Mucilaginibacter panaciglaebae TaxID=502331 RepID=UPI0031ED91B8